MQKKLVNFEIPALGEDYDIFVPEFLKVEVVLQMLIKAATELTEGRYVSSGCELLCIKESGMIMRSDEQLSSYCIRNGDHLALF